MEVALQYCGAKTPSPVSSRRLSQYPPPSSQRLRFAASVSSSCNGFYSNVKRLSCTSRGLRVSCERRAVDVIERNRLENLSSGENDKQLSCVMKFGGSSVASAERMREVASLILSFPEERPVIVLSAMGKTTNKLLLAGEKAVSCGITNVSNVDELNFIKELHNRTVDELGVDRSIIATFLEELEQLLKGIAMMKELTLRTKDYLVSFGECMSTRIFAAYLNKIGVKARQYDAFEIGFITTDDFTNADILEATYPAVAKRLQSDWISDPAIPIVTGFLGKGWRSCAVTTLGRGGSDLTATTLGKALGLREIQVWKDVDGVLTCDPNIYPHAEPVPYLTFDEAAELAYFGAQVLHPQSMKPARDGDVPVRVKNSYNPNAPGTSRGLRVSCERRAVDVIERNRLENLSSGENEKQLSCVMKFGGSSVASAERMKEVADLICSFPETRPVIVLSAMGKTTNKLLLAGEKAVSCGVTNVSNVDELNFIKELHNRTVDELGVDRSIIETFLEELEQLLKGIAMMKELTPRTKDYLVSFGECMSTRIFAAYLNKIGVKARQYDAFEIGFITTDDFTNADILEATYPAVAKRLQSDWISDPAIPIVTGFLGKGWRSCAVTTLGRGGSDLTATTLGKALGLREIQVWKDVDGVLTCDLNIYPRAEPVPYLTFDGAAKLAYIGALVSSYFSLSFIWAMRLISRVLKKELEKELEKWFQILATWLLALLLRKLTLAVKKMLAWLLKLIRVRLV